MTDLNRCRSDLAEAVEARGVRSDALAPLAAAAAATAIIGIQRIFARRQHR